MSNTALTGTPKAIAGSAFTLTADGGIASGYNGTPTLDTTKVNDHNSAAIAAAQAQNARNQSVRANIEAEASRAGADVQRGARRSAACVW